jgi:zinc transporter ZupT
MLFERTRYGLGGGEGRGLGVGACLGVGVGRGVVVGVTVAVAVGVGVTLGVAVGVGVGPEGAIVKAPLVEELFWKRTSLATIRILTSGIPVDDGSCQS